MKKRQNTDRSKDTKPGLGGVGSPLEKLSIPEEQSVHFIVLNREAGLLNTAQQGAGLLNTAELGARLMVHSCIEEAGSADLGRSSFQAVNIQEGESHGGHFLHTLSAFTH